MRVLALSAIAIAAALFTAGSIVRPEPPWGGPAAKRLAEQAYEARDRGDLELADSLLAKGLDLCIRARQPRAALRFRLAMAAARYSGGRFRAAGEAYLAAEREAKRLGDLEALTGVRVNLASLYAFFGDRASARRIAEQGLSCSPRADVYSTALQMLLATLYLEDGDAQRAVELLREVVSYPHLNEEVLRAAAWDALGNALIATGDLGGAESALAEALLVRRLGSAKARAGLPSSYAHFAVLRLAQGRPSEALTFGDQAIASGQPDIYPLYSPYYVRGRARQALGQSELALQDFGQALAFYTAWRTQALPADTLRAHSNAAIQEIYDAYAATAATLYERSGSEKYARLAWEADEANRAASLRETASAWRERVEPAYWGKLGRLRSLMLRASSGTKHSAGEIAGLHSELVNMEARAGLAGTAPTTPIDFRESIPSGNTLLLLQRQLGPGRAVVSFRLGERVSFRWTVTSRGFQGVVIAPRSSINQMALEFETAVRGGRSNDASGAALYRALFSGLPPEAESAPAWMVEPDGELFNTPFSALPVEAAQRPAFLAESHAVSLVPGAWAVGSRRPDRGPFAAVADPVYNGADPRLGPRFPALLASSDAGPDLPRLPGTRAESETCARAYSAANTIVLTGGDASRAGIERILAARPSVLHLATHIALADGSQEPVIVLSRGPGGAVDGLTSRDIAALSVPGSLVVMSGCSSARAAALPGDGLMGLGRAWLSAGARAVIATHWPVQDDTGALFRAFYSEYRLSNDASAALRSARTQMLRERRSRANPSYWAAYELMERSN